MEYQRNRTVQKRFKCNNCNEITSKLVHPDAPSSSCRCENCQNKLSEINDEEYKKFKKLNGIHNQRSNPLNQDYQNPNSAFDQISSKYERPPSHKFTRGQKANIKKNSSIESTMFQNNQQPQGNPLRKSFQNPKDSYLRSSQGSSLRNSYQGKNARTNQIKNGEGFRNSGVRSNNARINDYRTTNTNFNQRNSQGNAPYQPSIRNRFESQEQIPSLRQSHHQMNEERNQRRQNNDFFGLDIDPADSFYNFGDGFGFGLNIGRGPSQRVRVSVGTNDHSIGNSRTNNFSTSNQTNNYNRNEMPNNERRRGRSIEPRSFLEPFFQNFFSGPFFSEIIINAPNPRRFRVFRQDIDEDIFDPIFITFGSNRNNFENNFSSNFRSNMEQNVFERLINMILQNQVESNRSKHPPTKKEALEKLKRFKMSAKYCKKKNSKTELPNCCICISDISMGEESVLLPCGHIFHWNCCLSWLKRNNTCPVCRFELPSEGS